MKKRYIVGIIACVYVILQFVVLKKENDLGKNFKAKDGFPLIIAHGGSKALFPENTIYAYEKTMELGVDVLEIDLCMTKDNVLVTHHNLSIDDTSDGSGNVRDYTYEELSKFNFGAKFKDLDGNMPFQTKNDKLVPMPLEQLFEKYGKKVMFITEVKDEGELGKQAVRQLHALIRKYQLEDRVNVASFDHQNNEYFTSLDQGKTSISAGESKAKEMIYSMYIGYDFLLNYQTQGVQLPTFQTLPLDTGYIINKLHKHNLFVHYWTINDEKTMRELINKKVDGIISDRPDLLLKLKEEFKK